MAPRTVSCAGEKVELPWDCCDAPESADAVPGARVCRAIHPAAHINKINATVRPILILVGARMWPRRLRVALSSLFVCVERESLHQEPVRGDPEDQEADLILAT